MRLERRLELRPAHAGLHARQGDPAPGLGDAATYSLVLMVGRDFEDLHGASRGEEVLIKAQGRFGPDAGGMQEAVDAGP